MSQEDEVVKSVVDGEEITSMMEPTKAGTAMFKMEPQKRKTVAIASRLRSGRACSSSRVKVSVFGLMVCGSIAFSRLSSCPSFSFF